MKQEQEGALLSMGSGYQLLCVASSHLSMYLSRGLDSSSYLKSCQALTLAWEGRLLIVSGAEKGHFLSLPFPCSDTNMEMKLGSRILAFWKVHTV